MWGFQRTFRLGVEMGVTSSLSNLGTSVEPVVFLIGVSRTGGVGHPICIEPEDGLLALEDFSRLTIRAGQLYELDPDSKLIISATWLHERRQQRTLERAFGNAIAEILERKIGGGIRFFVANPTLVDQHHVYTAIGIPARVLVQTPRLSKRKAADGRIPVTGSLVQGAVDELLRVSARALLEPDAGAGADIGIEPADIARVAGRALTGAAVTLAGNVYGPPFYDALNWVSTTSYEQRVGLGRLVIADPGSEYVDRILTLRDSIPVTETRTLRKMLELSSRRRASLLTDGARVYGLGHMRDDYDPVSESVFEVVVVGHGSWDLRHAETTLMTVRNGAPHLPQPRLSRHRFDDITHRVFASTGGCDSDAVWELAMAAADARYGTMVVVSATAATEAERLRSQALTVEPGRLAPDVVRQVTSIDGAVLVDPNAACHAIGVILDGTAAREGDRSRGPATTPR